MEGSFGAFGGDESVAGSKSTSETLSVEEFADGAVVGTTMFSGYEQAEVDKQTVPMHLQEVATPPTSPDLVPPMLIPALYDQSVVAKVWGVALQSLKKVSLCSKV